ncbi:MAG TPA: M56 family metallopeptidase [Longimicrobiales bacterium]|nr:M56 family metallopeptidase [Longimicrobiales bacterium]
MILSSVAFLLAVSAVACAGAFLVEAGLRRLGVATRFAWLGALALGPVFLGLGILDALRPGAAPAPPPWAVVELPALTFGPATPAGGLGAEGVAALLWILSGLALASLVLRTHRALLRERVEWEWARVLERDVYVSADRGPAVAGVWDPWIVLPRWVLALPETELRMVLLHEEEHMRARDTYLLGAALALVALSAWNPITWWQLRRLRTAMEVDCDRRVLRQVPDRVTYGTSLLTVAARASGPSLGLAAFTERSLNLRRRILAMTAKTSRWTALAGGVLVVFGLVVGVQACGVESPVGLAPRSEGQPAPAAPEATTFSAREVSKPFTQAPRLLNGDAVAEAMERQYPALLKDAGVGGAATIFMFVDTTGTVTDVRIQKSSGHQPLDDAALRVARVFRFDPARNKEQKVDTWVAFPIRFGAPEPAPSPPASELTDPASGPVFTPFTVAPSIVNRQEVIAAMVREYPSELREQGIGGTVRVYFLVDDDGTVARSIVDRSSGNTALDEAALKVASVYRFTPALNKDKKVPVWVSFPLTFQMR